MAKPCFSSFLSSSEQNSVRDNREKTAVIRIPTSITQKLPLRRYALVDLHWKHTRFDSLKRTRRLTRTRIRFAKSTNLNDRINEIYLLSRRASTPLSCLRASSMLSLSRVEITVKTKDDYVYVYMYIPMTERVRARETWHFFGSKNLCRGSRGGGNLKAPVDSFFSFSKRCSSQGLRMRTEDPCDRATVHETRKAAPQVPPIRLRVTTNSSPLRVEIWQLRQLLKPIVQNISPSFCQYQQPLGPYIFESLSSLFTLFFLIGGNLG